MIAQSMQVLIDYAREDLEWAKSDLVRVMAQVPIARRAVERAEAKLARRLAEAKQQEADDARP